MAWFLLKQSLIRADHTDWLFTEEDLSRIPECGKCSAPCNIETLNGQWTRSQCDTLSKRPTWTNGLPRSCQGRRLFCDACYVPDGPLKVVGHSGKKVYGKARHRDAVRSSHSHTVFRYGHKWIVLAIFIELPYTYRPFALPVLVALYRDKKICAADRRRHETAAEIMRGLLAVLTQWFLERKLIFNGDNACGTHAIARLAAKHVGN